MSLPCNVVRDLVSIYKDGLASEETSDAVELHLKQCPDCRKYYREYDSISRLNAAKYNVCAENSTAKEYADLSQKLRVRRSRVLTAVALLTCTSIASLLLLTIRIAKDDQ